jgi:hypothetical protein
MKYARSEPHIDEMLSSLCASKWLDAASFDAVAEHKTSFQHHFLRRSDQLSAEEKRNYDMVRSILVGSFGVCELSLVNSHVPHCSCRFMYCLVIRSSSPPM